MPGYAGQPSEPRVVTAFGLVPEVVPGDAEVGEHHAEQGEADADDVVRVPFEAGDERAAEPVDREAAGDGLGLARRRVRLDLLFGQVRKMHQRLRVAVRAVNPVSYTHLTLPTILRV